MAAPLVIERLGDVREAIAVPVGPTAPVTITQQMIDQFADVTRDQQWIHVSPSQAAQGPFGTTIAHGYLTLSLIPHFLDQLISRAPHVTSINYGLDTVRFPSTVPVNSSLTMTASVLEVEERAQDSARVRIKCTLTSAHAERPACVATAILLYTGLR